MTQTSNTVAFTVSAAPTAPSWFVSQTNKTWVALAGGSGYGSAWQNGNRLYDVRPSPEVSSAYQDMFRAWNGACVMQATGEYIKAAEGGHATYTGNEAYALALRQETPAWSRLIDPTTSANITTAEVAYNAPYVSYLDGQPRTSHGWFSRVCSASHIWLTRTSDNVGSLTWTTDVWSLDRNNLSEKWVYRGRLWTSIPSPGSAFIYSSGPGAYDSVANRIWRAPNQTTGSIPSVAYIDVTTCVAAGAQSSSGPQTPGSTQVAAGGWTDLDNYAWSAVVTDSSPRVWVCGTDNGGIKVMNAESPGSWTTKSVTGSLAGTSAWGGGYSPAHGAIFISGISPGSTTNAAVKKITVPADPINGTYVVTDVTNGAGSATPSVNGNTPWNGSFGQVQLIEDMGNGEAALVSATSHLGPAYVYKLTGA